MLPKLKSGTYILVYRSSLGTFWSPLVLIHSSFCVLEFCCPNADQKYILHSVCWSYVARMQTKIRRSFQHYVRGWPGLRVSQWWMYSRPTMPRVRSSWGLGLRDIKSFMRETSPSSSAVQYPSFTGAQKSFSHPVFRAHYSVPSLGLKRVSSSTAGTLIENYEC
jgi:hypothetical protein